MNSEIPNRNITPRLRFRFMGRARSFKFLAFACVLGWGLPLLPGQPNDKAAMQESQAMLLRMKRELYANPEKNATLLVAFVKGVVDAKTSGQSLAARMSDTALWSLLEDTGKFIPPDFRSQGSAELTASLNVLETELASKKVALPNVRQGTYWNTVSAVLKWPSLRKVYDRIRNPSDSERHWAFIGLARSLGKFQTEPAVVKLDQSGRKKITHIRQQPNHCVSACGLMALQRLIGMDLPPELQSHLAGLSSRAAVRGNVGANPGFIYTKMGLDILGVNYAEELKNRRIEERMRFAVAVLTDRIAPELKSGKLVVLSIESMPLHHAILLSGVSEDGQFEVIDPAGAVLTLNRPDRLAKKWYIEERESLSAVIISFPELPDPAPQGPPAQLSLEIPPELLPSWMTKFDIDRDNLTVENMNAVANSFRWIDMTQGNKEAAEPADLNGIPFAIQLQLLAGRPVGTFDRKGNRLLFTGYSGPLGGADTTFKMETSEGPKDSPWKEVVKSLTLKSNAGQDTLYLGYLVNEIGPCRLKF